MKKENKKDLISIIVPCYNEEESLPIFYDAIKEVSNKVNADFEYIFINDGSRDKTLEILRKLSKKDNRVRYISFSKNYGKEAGMLAGLRSVRGNYAAIMDADMQDPPEMIIDMYKTLQNEDYDVVALCSPKHKGYSPVRKIFTNCYYKIANKIMTVEQVPGARDFRLMKRIVVDSIISMPEYNRYTKGIFSFVGFKTKWIEYEAPDRVAGTSTWNFWKLFKYALEGIMAFSTAPLVLSVFIGIMLCILAVIALIIGLINTMTELASVAILLTFLAGLNISFIGILGMYMSKMYLEVKNRPLYIVAETEDK